MTGYAAHELDALADDAAPFPRRRRWVRNERGTLWLVRHGRLLCVFQRPRGSGWYAWSLKYHGKVRFSATDYPTEAEAMAAVMEEVG